MSALGTQIQVLLAADASAQRSELAALAFDVVARLPLVTFVERSALLEAIDLTLTHANAELVLGRHVLPALTRLTALLAGRTESIRDLLSEPGTAQVRAIVTSGSGPRFAWLRGALDGDDLRQLIAPVVQQMLQQFTARLPIPGLGSAGAGVVGGAAGVVGGLVGRLGKQVQRSAGQLADVGRSMLGGVIRDFSETATSDFRKALKERLASPEGERIVERMRTRFLDHVLQVEVDDIVQDFMRLPPQVGSELVATLVEHHRTLPLLRMLREAGVDAALAELEARSIEALLRELGLYETTRAQGVRALDSGVRAVAASPEFAAWLERLVATPAESA